MLAHEIAALSCRLILDCYYNRPQGLLDHCDENVVWYSPDSRILHGRDTLCLECDRLNSRLRFALRDMAAAPYVTSGASSCDVFLNFLVDTSWPDGTTKSVEQQVQLSWMGCDTDTPTIALVHMTNITARERCGDIVALYLEAARVADAAAPEHAAQAATETTATEQRLCLRGMGHTMIYLDPADVMFIKSKGRHSLFHTADGRVFESVEALSCVAQQFEGLFTRCHASYLVNPAYVRGIVRFKVILANGDELPIPEKRYTAIRKEITERIGSNGHTRETPRNDPQAA